MKRDTKSFLEELKIKGFKFEDYDYSLVDYKNTNTKVILIDKKFNTKHSITPKELLKGKCRLCQEFVKERFEDSTKNVYTIPNADY